VAAKLKKALLVLNPAAKGCRGVDLGRIADVLASAGLDVETVASGTPDAPARDARSRGFERVVVAGGDGSLRSVLCATDLPVGLLPMGGSNSVARSVGIPLSIPRAADIAARGVVRSLDMGEVSGPNVNGGTLPFMLCASAGIDAEAARRYELGRAGRWQGFSRYIVVSFATALRHAHIPIDVSCDGRPVARGAKLVVAANMSVYAGWFRFAPGADPGDGALDLVAIRAEGLMGIGSAYGRAFFGARQRPDRSLVRRVRSMRWESPGEVPLEIDGEPVGRLPVDITVRSGAARMVLPGPSK